MKNNFQVIEYIEANYKKSQQFPTRIYFLR